MMTWGLNELRNLDGLHCINIYAHFSKILLCLVSSTHHIASVSYSLFLILLQSFPHYTDALYLTK
jgi:hypothetical protein